MAASRKPTVTVIVPTFNREKYLPEAIDSLLRQTVAPDQILIVDDGSTDNTSTVAASYPAPVEYFRKENGGKSTALNLALKHSTGDFVWVFDDDDVAHPTALERFLAAFEREPTADFAFGEYARFQQSAQIEEENYAELDDADIIRLVAVTDLKADAGFTAAFPAKQGADVTVHLRDGRTIRHALPDVIAATPAEVRMRFRAAAHGVLGEDRAHRLEQLIENCERLGNAGDIVAQCRLDAAERVLRSAS